MKIKSNPIKQFFSKVSAQKSTPKEGGTTFEEVQTHEVNDNDSDTSSSAEPTPEENKHKNHIGEEPKSGKKSGNPKGQSADSKGARDKKKNSQTEVYNVVILDCSGSMDLLRRAAVSGFNETLQTIRSAQKKYHDTQKHYVSLIAFSSNSISTIYDSVPVDKVDDLKIKDYRPGGCTPLYDAMGLTICRLSKKTDDLADAAVFVTVITDGYENSSTEFDGHSIRQMVEAAREKGWTFTYMGANQDAVEVSMNLAIRNSRNFSYDDEGARGCMEKDSSTRMNFFSRLHRFKASEDVCNPNMSAEDRRRNYANLADEAFDEEEQKS